MKKLVLVVAVILTLGSCSVNTSGNIDIDAEDIKYVKDDRTGLCFGFVASRRNMSAETEGLGMTCVPCEDVKNHLE